MPAIEARAVPDDAWIDRVADATGDDAGPTLREWRRSTKTSQAEAARRLGMTQQNLSQIETGRHPMSYELRRRAVDELGIAPADLGLSAGWHEASDRGVADQVRESQARWRFERRWLNQHRPDLAGLAAGLYPAEHRSSRHPLIAAPEWVPDEPIDLRSIALDLDEDPQRADGRRQRAGDGANPPAAQSPGPLRPLHRRGEVPRPAAAVRVPAELPAS